MYDNFDVVVANISSQVNTNGTFTMGYPAMAGIGTYKGGRFHTMWSKSLQTLFKYGASNFTISFGATVMTVTYLGVTPLPAGDQLTFQLDRLGPDTSLLNAWYLAGKVERIAPMVPAVVNLGSPLTAAANAHLLSASLTAASGGVAPTTGALAGVNDVPRNIVAAWTGTSVLTVTGLDEYGNVMHESSASGTSFTGKKAFKSISLVAVSADVTALTVGNGVVLGLPVFLPEASCVIGESQDGAKPTAGTTVAGDLTNPATATTGDTRGTYNPNAAPDGSKGYQLFILTDKPSDLGYVTPF